MLLDGYLAAAFRCNWKQCGAGLPFALFAAFDHLAKPCHSYLVPWLTFLRVAGIGVVALCFDPLNYMCNYVSSARCLKQLLSCDVLCVAKINAKTHNLVAYSNVRGWGGGWALNGVIATIWLKVVCPDPLGPRLLSIYRKVAPCYAGNVASLKCYEGAREEYVLQLI